MGAKASGEDQLRSGNGAPWRSLGSRGRQQGAIEGFRGGQGHVQTWTWGSGCKGTGGRAWEVVVALVMDSSGQKNWG